MTNWDAHDARATGLTPKAEAALIRRMAADRALDALRHKGKCLCCGCRVREWAAKQRQAKNYADTMAAGYVESLGQYTARLASGRP